MIQAEFEMQWLNTFENIEIIFVLQVYKSLQELSQYIFLKF